MNDLRSDGSRPLSVNEWFITILILALPLINIIMYFYWAFADGVNLNKRNFCRASLLWAVIGIGIGIIALVFAGIAGALGGG